MLKVGFLTCTTPAAAPFSESVQLGGPPGPAGSEHLESHSAHTAPPDGGLSTREVLDYGPAAPPMDD